MIELTGLVMTLYENRLSEVLVRKSKCRAVLRPRNSQTHHWGLCNADEPWTRASAARGITDINKKLLGMAEGKDKS
jgi:hypothetical protein